MSEKFFGTIMVIRSAFARTISEQLVFTPDRVIVARISGGFGGMMFGAIGGAIEGAIQYRQAKKKEEEYAKTTTLEDILKADKHNYAIPNSDITKVEFKKSWGSYSLHITTSKGKFKWGVLGLLLNETLLTPSERQKFKEEVEIPSKEGSILKGERARAFEAAMKWGERRILRLAFPEDKLSIKLPG